MTDLNKNYSGYDGTEVVRRSKILKFVEIGATAGSGTNYESSYAQLAIEKLSKR